VHVLVPVKTSAWAKSRLSAVLDAQGRAQLVAWMLEGVLRAAAAVRARSLRVVGGDARTVTVARRYGVEIVPELGHDLNETLSLAAALVRRPGLEPCLFLAADLPFVTGDDVQALIDDSQDGRIAAIAPAADGDGTNALVVPKGCAFEPAFGPASRVRHRLLLERQGVRVVEVHRPGLAFDVDLPAHLERVRSMMPVGYEASRQ